MTELRQRAAREPDAAPEDKVAAASMLARPGSGAPRRSAGPRAEGSSRSLTLLLRPTAAPGSTGGLWVGGLAERVKGEVGRNPGSGDWLEMASPGRKKERAGGCAGPPASSVAWGPHLREAFLVWRHRDHRKAFFGRRLI